MTLSILVPVIDQFVDVDIVKQYIIVPSIIWRGFDLVPNLAKKDVDGFACGETLPSNSLVAPENSFVGGCKFDHVRDLAELRRLPNNL